MFKNVYESQKLSQISYDSLNHDNLTALIRLSIKPTLTGENSRIWIADTKFFGVYTFL